MFRIFILTAIVLAMTLPAAAQRRGTCTVPEDPLERQANGFVAPIWIEVNYLVEDGFVKNLFLPLPPEGNRWLPDVTYDNVLLVSDALEEPEVVSLPERPTGFNFAHTFQTLWADSIRPELCNLERMGLIPARSSILGGN